MRKTQEQAQKLKGEFANAQLSQNDLRMQGPSVRLTIILMGLRTILPSRSHSKARRTCWCRRCTRAWSTPPSRAPSCWSWPTRSLRGGVRLSRLHADIREGQSRSQAGRGARAATQDNHACRGGC